MDMNRIFFNVVTKVVCFTDHLTFSQAKIGDVLLQNAAPQAKCWGVTPSQCGAAGENLGVYPSKMRRRSANWRFTPSKCGAAGENTEVYPLIMRRRRRKLRFTPSKCGAAGEQFEIGNYVS